MLRLTNSEMSTFRRCKRKWWLGHHRGLRRKAIDAAGTPLTLGTTVHDALAVHYDPRTRQDPRDYLVKLRDTKIQESPAAEFEIRKELQLAEIMVEGYMQWLEETGHDSDLRVLMPESKVEVPLVEGVTLLAKLDARVERISTGHRLALEHKTVQSLKQPLPLLQLDSQLLTEHLVEFLDLRARGQEDQRAGGVLYNMLRKVKRTAAAKPPFYDREEVLHNDIELRSHWYHVVGIARDILATAERLDAGENHHKVVPPSPDRSCSWQCPFFGICPLFDDGSDAEQAIADLYEVGNPLERYEGVESYEEVM